MKPRFKAVSSDFQLIRYGYSFLLLDAEKFCKVRTAGEGQVC